MNWFLIIVFGMLPFVGALFAARTIWLMWHGERMPGTITGYERVRAGERNKTFYMPIVKFCDRDGTTHTITMKMSETPKKNIKRESVTVIYPKGTPQEARLERFASLWLIPFFFCGPAIMLGMIVGGHYLWWWIFD